MFTIYPPAHRKIKIPNLWQMGSEFHNLEIKQCGQYNNATRLSPMTVKVQKY